MIDPSVEAARDIAGESLAALRAAVEGLAADDLNRRPAGDETNPIAVLAVHAVSSTRWWLSVAFGFPPPERDRPSEFRAETAGAEELLALVDPIADECRTLLATDGPFDAAAIREDPRDGERITAAWALMHAVEHLREHVAHAELTRQILAG
jgi:DinB superfamily